MNGSQVATSRVFLCRLDITLPARGYRYTSRVDRLMYGKQYRSIVVHYIERQEYGEESLPEPTVFVYGRTFLGILVIYFIYFLSPFTLLVAVCQPLLKILIIIIII